MFEAKYPYTTKVAKAILSLVHGSTGVKRGFSESGNLLTSNRSNIDERWFNAQCAILDGLKMYDNKSYKVPNTSKLLRLAQDAHRSYQIYLEDQKRVEDEMKKQKEKDEKILDKEKEIAGNFKNEVTTKKCLENDLKFSEHEQKEASKDAEDMLVVFK